MRQLTNSEIQKLNFLTSKDLEVSLIEVTKTGIEKSIMDATGTVRDYLKRHRVHDYMTQRQGPDHKIQVATQIITQDSIIEQKTSMYRPKTKLGDPRIWVNGMKPFVSASDIIALTYYDGQLWFFNLTQLPIIELASMNSPFSEFLKYFIVSNESVSQELLAKLRVIAARGFIPSNVDADTAIGRLLETELGVAANSSQNPDYKGIELKSFRSKRSNRMNLFAQVPNWKISKYKSSKDILHTFGYDRSGVKKLYCSVSARVTNSQGLSLILDEESGLLHETSSDRSIGNFATWELGKLHERISTKHAETFWVEADTKRENGIEYFKFKKVEHTRGPILTQFDTLLGIGKIELDHLIKEKPNGSVQEKGPLFKLHHDGLGLLFPPSTIYEL